MCILNNTQRLRASPPNSYSLRSLTEILQKRRSLTSAAVTAFLGIAAKMLGAKRVVCVDIDENALEIARRNAQKLGVEVELAHSDVRDFNEKGDTVVMNPPFGAQIANRHADRVFVERALDVANVVYSIHNARSDLSAFLPECVSVECYSAVFPF